MIVAEVGSGDQVATRASFRDPQVNVYAVDVDRTAGFYALLGFTETFRTPADGRPIHVEMTLGGLKLGVASAASAAADHGLVVTAGGAGAEVCVWTDDVDAAHDALVVAGAGSMSEPHDWLDGALRVAWVTDPEGNPVELVQRRA